MKDLKLFIQPDILQRIGARRLGKLLRPFAPELQAINFPMPPPDEPDQNHYFHTLAAAIARTHTLPQSLLKTLLTLETAAAPESSTALGDAIKRRVPYVSLPPDFVIDHALEVWLVAPEELARFAPPPVEWGMQNEDCKMNSSATSASLAEIENQNRAIYIVPPTTSCSMHPWLKSILRMSGNSVRGLQMRRPVEGIWSGCGGHRDRGVPAVRKPRFGL